MFMLLFCRAAVKSVYQRVTRNTQPQNEQVPSALNSDRSEDGAQVGTTQVQLPFIPCRYSDFGCHEISHFPEEVPNAHERTCEYRTYTNCPILPRDCNARKRSWTKKMCNWVGSYHDLKEHCREKHPEHLIEHYFVDMPDLTKSYSENYLVTASRLLFLLQIKVCVESGKCFHSIRMFGDSKLLDKFWCWLEFHGSRNFFSAGCTILGTEMLTLDESTAGFTPIEKFLDGTANDWASAMMVVEIYPTNLNCSNCQMHLNYEIDFNFCCICFEKLVKCKNHGKGCLFKDINTSKCTKHERLFCEYRTKCFGCGVNFARDSLMEHLTLENCCRRTICSDINSVVRVTLNSGFILFSGHKTGTIICRYMLSKYTFEFWVYTSFPSYEFKKHKCSIELTNPLANFTQIFVPEITSSRLHDWFIEVTKDDFPSWENVGIDIKLNFD